MQGFFAIGAEEWRRACDLGLNAACSFLVLACGTGRDNQTTAWSSNAVQQYAGIRWERAKPAIDQLISAGLVSLVEGSTKSRPRYKLAISEDKIWLPKNIVTPLAGETPVVMRLLQVQDVLLLRLFVELYHAQNLAADGGISRAVYYRKYKKTICRDVGPMVYLGFEDDNVWVSWETKVTQVHKGKGEKRADELFARLGLLQQMGLLQEAKYLFESSDPAAEILFPVNGPEPEESSFYLTAGEVIEANLPGGAALVENYDYVVPVYRHQQKAELYGIFRMRFRAQTTTTGAWYAMIKDKSEAARAMLRAAML
jgi:hypothetical protein